MAGRVRRAATARAGAARQRGSQGSTLPASRLPAVPAAAQPLPAAAAAPAAPQVLCLGAQRARPQQWPPPRLRSPNPPAHSTGPQDSQ